MKPKLLRFLKKYKWALVIVLLLLIIVSELIYFTYTSYPRNPLYQIKKTIIYKSIESQTTHKAKAKLYLDNSTQLQWHLDMLLKNKGSYEDLKAVAGELLYNQQKAVEEMDLARQEGSDIKSEVEVLCDTLIKQQAMLKMAMVKSQKIATLPFEQYANITKILLDESAGW